MTKWVTSRVSSLADISGYKKPERYAHATRMDTNENLALPKKFVAGIIKEASERRIYESIQVISMMN